MKRNYFYILFFIINVLLLCISIALVSYYGISGVFDDGVYRPFVFWGGAFVNIIILSGIWIVFDILILLWFKVKHNRVRS